MKANVQVTTKKVSVVIEYAEKKISFIVTNRGVINTSVEDYKPFHQLLLVKLRGYKASIENLKTRINPESSSMWSGDSKEEEERFIETLTFQD